MSLKNGSRPAGLNFSNINSETCTTCGQMTKKWNTLQAWVVLLFLTSEGHIYSIPILAPPAKLLWHEITLRITVVGNRKTTVYHWKELKILKKAFLHQSIFCFCNAHFPEKQEKNDTFCPKVGSPRPMVLGPPGKHKLGHMKGNVLVLTVARIAKRLRKFLALSMAWHC